ncbi:MAG: FeoA family protein [Desulfitobacteriaceae bacterium]
MDLLSKVEPGIRVRVESIRGGGILRRRMLDMGILPGVELEIVRQAPLGGPVQLKLRGYFLAMRRSECAQVVVCPIDSVEQGLAL